MAKKGLLATSKENWFAIDQKWFTVTKQFGESLCQSDSQLRQMRFAFFDAIPPISSPV